MDTYGTNPANCIYAITAKDGATYVGQTSTYYSVRIHNHFWKLSRSEHPNKSLQAYYDLHGKDSLTATLLEAVDKQALNEREKHWIEYYRTQDKCFNLLSGGSGLAAFNEVKKHRPKATWQLLTVNDEVVTFSNYKSWCIANGLAHGTIWKLLKGQQSHYAGYRNIDEQGKVYTLLTPEGEQVEVNNVVAFAREHELDASTLYKVIHAKQFEHKGYSNPDNTRPPKPMPRARLTDEEKAERYKLGLEKQRVKSLARYHANPTAINKRTMELRKANPEAMARVQVATAIWKSKNKQRLAAYNKDYYAARKVSKLEKF